MLQTRIESLWALGARLHLLVTFRKPSASLSLAALQPRLRRRGLSRFGPTLLRAYRCRTIHSSENPCHDCRLGLEQGSRLPPSAGASSARHAPCAGAHITNSAEQDQRKSVQNPPEHRIMHVDVKFCGSAFARTIVQPTDLLKSCHRRAPLPQNST